MNPMMDPRRAASDAASYSSTGSIWSTSDSVSFVYTDDDDWAWWGYEGIRGAVTRQDDKRDDRRVRVAAHFLRGPFAGHKSKKHSSSRHSHRRDSDTRSNYSSSSGHSSSGRRQRDFSRGPSPMPPPPPNAYPGPPPPPPPPPHHQPAQYYDQQYDNFSHGSPMGMRPPPPPPPPMTAPAQPGFEAGFIQIGGGGGGGGGGGPSAHHDPWNNEAYDEEQEVWD